MKVVIGDRRIGKQQAVSRPEWSLKGRAASLAAALVETLAAALEAAIVAALAGRQEPWTSRRACDRGAASIINLPQSLAEYLG